MKLTKKLLVKHGIHNPHNFCTAGGGRLFISYTPQDLGRGGHRAHWQVVGIKTHTDLTGAWYNNGHKTFTTFSAEGDSAWARRVNALDAAMKWADEKYGITEWHKDPFGGWQEAFVMTNVTQMLEAKERGKWKRARHFV